MNVIYSKGFGFNLQRVQALSIKDVLDKVMKEQNILPIKVTDTGLTKKVLYFEGLYS